jgi:hypothetical protein
MFHKSVALIVLLGFLAIPSVDAADRTDFFSVDAIVRQSLPKGCNAHVERRQGVWCVTELSVTQKLPDELVRLPEFRFVEKITLATDRRITSDEIREFGKFTRLRHLIVTQSLNKDQWQAVCTLTSLEELAVPWPFKPELPTDELKYVQALSGLRRLSLASIKPNDLALGYLKILKKLEHLDLRWDADFTALDKTKLSGLTALRHLYIPNLDARTLAKLAELPRLEHLDVDFVRSSENIADFSRLTRLHSLRFNGIDGKNIKMVLLPESLLELVVNYTPTAKIDPQTAKHIRRIEIKLSEIDDPPASKSLSWLSAVPELSELSLTEITDQDLADIPKLVNLRSLALESQLCPPNMNYDGPMKSFASLTHLESLRLRGLRMTDAGLDELRHFPNLRDFELVGPNEVTFAGLDRITTLKHLRRLEISVSENSEQQSLDTFCSRLAKLPELEEIALRGLITDKILEAFSKIKNLRMLDLSGAAGYTWLGVATTVAELPKLDKVDYAL